MKINIGFKITNDYFDYFFVKEVKDAIRKNKYKSKILIKDASRVTKYLNDRVSRRKAREIAEKARSEKLHFNINKLLQKRIEVLKEVIDFSDFTRKKNVMWYDGLGYGSKWMVFHGTVGDALTAAKWVGWNKIKRHEADIEAMSPNFFKIGIGGGWDEEIHQIHIPKGYIFDFKNRKIIKKLSDNAYYLFNGKKYQLVVVYHREEYHFTWRDSEYKNINAKIQEGIKRIKKRRQEAAKRLWQQRLERRKWNEIVSNTWVSVEDSIAAGNCKPLTEDFAIKLKEKLNLASIDVCLKADIILSYRDDFYVRRTIMKAAERR